MLKRSMVWFATFFGTDHPIVTQHVAFLTELLRDESTYEVLQVSDSRLQRHVPAFFLRWFQLRFCHWMNTQWASPVVIPVPNVTEVFQKIAVGEAWEPQLPLQYELALRRVPMPPGSNNFMSLGGGGSSRGNEGGGGGGGIVGNGGNNGGGGGNGGGAEGPQNNIVRNNAYKQDLFGQFARLPLRTRSVLQNAAKPPPICPLCPTGQTRMCLAFHIKGMCNERCSRAIDHCEYTEAQDAQLVQWCTAHYRA